MEKNVLMVDNNRGHWANKTEFILSCLGYAIGIGNVWRFPYLCYRNGGGAFLVPYLLMLFLCGIPLFFMEISLGQFASTGCISIFKISPLFKGAGYAIVIVNFFCTIYFNVIVSYPILFLTYCFNAQLPWANCDNSWNTEHCIQLNNRDKEEIKALLTGNQSEFRYKTTADEFFNKEILQISDGIDNIGSIIWPLFFSNFFVWIVVYLCIMLGVKSIGKVVYFTATFPFVILIILLIRGVTLPGAMDGIYFYIYPQWHQLTNLKVWADAAIQIFFSLGPGWGGIINMASYNNFRNNNKFDSILVPIMNCGTSILAGFVVFSVLGFMSHQTGLPVSSVASGGPDLAFVTYPEAISMLPLPQLWAVLFFIMLFLLGLDSAFVQIEAICSSVIDNFPIIRPYKVIVTLAACLVMFSCSTLFVTNGGMYYLQLFDWYAASISVILICLIETIIVGWIYGVNRFTSDVEFMIERKISIIWKICWKFITPVVLSFIFVTTIAFNTRITYHDVIYPNWSVTLGWGTCLVSIMCIPIYMGYKLLYFADGDLIERLAFSMKPTIEWGPARYDHRKQWLELTQHKLIQKVVVVEKSDDLLHNQFLELVA